MNDTQQKIENFRQEFTALDHLITEALNGIYNGQVAFLQNLEQKAMTLCQRVLSAEPAVAQETKPMMADMIARLGELESSLTQLKQDLETKV